MTTLPPTKGENDEVLSSPLRDCVVIGKMKKNVMLNLVQHLKSKTYETLKQVQGDTIGVTTQSLMGED